MSDLERRIEPRAKVRTMIVITLSVLLIVVIFAVSRGVSCAQSETPMNVMPLRR